VSSEPIGFGRLRHCFEGAVPVVIATVSSDGTPNVTFLSKAHLVDDQRIALSNQFLSKSARNLAEHPRASLLFVDPATMEEYRVDISYERTERRGRVFEQLRQDVDAIAAMTGMEDVFRLRSADIYRLVHIEQVPPGERADGTPGTTLLPRPAEVPPTLAAVAELSARLGRCTDLDTLVRVAVGGLADLLGHEHSLLLLLDETSDRLFTLASHGYEEQGVGSELAVGEGVVGMAARTGAPIRLGNARQMGKYARRLRAGYESTGDLGPGREVALPGLPHPDSCIAVPLRSLGHVVGVLAVESAIPARYSHDDEAALTLVASVLASAIEALGAEARDDAPSAPPAPPAPPDGETPAAPPAAAPPGPGPGRGVRVRFFGVDGSTFLDGDYLIKGVAGRILWSLLRQHESEGRVDFTNREVRLDPSLDLPELRDNFESRLILLKRRLEERGAPIQIEKTGRGRFRLRVERDLVLDEASAGS
jgi:predicted pyridoxine 5'-phosphate oxidase superfamily flavin-nucleotide-binding protein